MEVVKQADREIVLSREFAAPRAAVFSALTQPEQIRQWMKPAGMTLTACEVDLRAGGAFKYGFETAKGRKLEVRGRYDSVDPPSGFRYQESYDFSPLTILVTTNLDQVGGHTRFKQVLLYRTAAERNDDFAGVAASAEGVYAILEHYLQSTTAAH